jgi:hypothetical protein
VFSCPAGGLTRARKARLGRSGVQGGKASKDPSRTGSSPGILDVVVRMLAGLWGEGGRPFRSISSPTLLIGADPDADRQAKLLIYQAIHALTDSRTARRCRKLVKAPSSAKRREQRPTT